jgi:hypothetical protein
MDEKRNTLEFSCGKLMERDHVPDVGIDGMLVKWVSERWDWRRWTRLIWLRTGTSCGIVSKRGI